MCRASATAASPIRWRSSVADGRRRGLLDDLLEAALQRALPLAEVDNVSEAIAEHLDLDVARRGREELLDVDRRVAKGPTGVTPHALERGLDLLRRVRDPHPVATAAGRGLDRHGIAQLTGYRGDLVRIRQRILGPGNDRHPGRLGRPTRGDLAPHGLDRLRAAGR